MLDDKTLEWLEKRLVESCETCKTHRLMCAVCSRKRRFDVWADDYFSLSGCRDSSSGLDFLHTAEFEAKVAAKMTKVTVGDLPCGIGPDNNECQKPHFRKYHNEERAIGCDMCALMVARLAVEAEEEE